MKERKKKSRGRKAIPGNLAQWAVQLEEKKKNKRKKKRRGGRERPNHPDVGPKHRGRKKEGR
jgi:hypothetical protein